MANSSAERLSSLVPTLAVWAGTSTTRSPTVSTRVLASTDAMAIRWRSPTRMAVSAVAKISRSEGSSSTRRMLSPNGEHHPESGFTADAVGRLLRIDAGSVVANADGELLVGVANGDGHRAPDR